MLYALGTKLMFFLFISFWFTSMCLCLLIVCLLFHNS